MELKHPESFADTSDRQSPLARWGGKITELIEYMLPLQISGRLRLPSGQAMEYADLIRFLQASLGINIPGEYDRKTEVLSRNKPTVFIEKMLGVMKELVKKIHQ